MARVKDIIERYPNYFERLSYAESSGGKYLTSKTSSAAGPYHFLKDTWKEMVDLYNLPYTSEDRFDNEKALEVGKLFTERNRKYISSQLGRDLNDTELYFGHVFGMGGATKALKSIQENPYNYFDTSIFSEEVIKGNRGIFYSGDRLRSGAEVYEEMSKRIGSKEGNMYNNPPKTSDQLLQQYNDPYAKELYNETLTNLPNTTEKPIFDDSWKDKLFEAREEREHISNMLKLMSIPETHRNILNRKSNVIQE